jgi:hypothetical protein
MNLTDLLTAVSSSGIKLSTDPASTKLVVSAPRGVMTDELKAALVAHKAMLLAQLAREASGQGSGHRSSYPSSRINATGPERETKSGTTATATVESVESVEVTVRDRADTTERKADTGGLRWPYNLARWPIPDRQRWGELANRIEAAGVNWREAERRAYEIVRDERAAAGRSRDCVPVEEYPTPDPFPAWEELIDPRDYLPDPDPGPRPPGRPTWGVTRSIRVVELVKVTSSQQARDPVTKVTAEGWDRWFPAEPGDLLPKRGQCRAATGRDYLDRDTIQNQASIEANTEPSTIGESGNGTVDAIPPPEFDP